MAERPTVGELRTLLAYDPQTGALRWRWRRASLFSTGGKGRDANASAWNKRYADKEAFTSPTPRGYLQGQLRGTWKAHHIAWAIFHGRWPSEIDHINGDKSDNRLCNLREVTRRENSMNRKVRSDNLAGAQGVSQRKGRWRARITIDGKHVQIGTFDTKEEAIAARRKAEVEHGYHPNHGRAS